MAYSKKISHLCSVLAVLPAVFCLSSTVWAQGSAVPGRSVGHVFLGMDRADVWKSLSKPVYSAAVPHGTSLYTEDEWVSGSNTLKVISERDSSKRDKVVQVESDSPRLTTANGFSTRSTLDQIRRRCPAATLSAYNLVYHLGNGGKRRANGFYIDDVYSGLAFIITNKAIDADYAKCTPAAIIIHKAGRQALPIGAGDWLGPPILNFPH